MHIDRSNPLNVYANDDRVANAHASGADSTDGAVSTDSVDTGKFRKSSVTNRAETNSIPDKNQHAEPSPIHKNASYTGENSVWDISVVPPGAVEVRCAAHPGLQDMPYELLLNIFSRLNFRDIAVIKNTFEAADRVVNDILSTKSKRWFSRFSPLQQTKFNKIAEGSTDELVLRTWLGQFTKDETVVKHLLENRHHRHFPKLLFYAVSRLMADCQAFKVEKVVSIDDFRSFKQPDFSDDGNHMMIRSFGQCIIYALSPDGHWVKKTTICNDKRVFAAKFAGDGRHIVTESVRRHYKIHVLDSDGNWIVESTLPQGRGVNFVKFSPNALRVAIIVNTFPPYTLKIFGRGTDGAWAEEYDCPDHGSMALRPIAFTRDGNELMVKVDEGFFFFCRGSDGRWETKPALVGETGFFGKFSPNDSHMTTIFHQGGSDYTAKIFGRDTNGNWIVQAEIDHKGFIFSADFSANSRYVVTSSDDKTSAIYYLATNGSWIKKAIIDFQKGILTRLSPDGRYLAIYPIDNTVKLYSLGADGQCIEKTHIDSAQAAFFSPDGNHIFTRDHDDLVRCYGLGQDGKLVLKATFELDQPMSSFSISPTGRYLMTSGDDGKPKIWLLSAENEPGYQEMVRE